jgi:hypothetical protein
VHPTGLYKQEPTPWVRASLILGRNSEPPLQSRNPRYDQEPSIQEEISLVVFQRLGLVLFRDRERVCVREEFEGVASLSMPPLQLVPAGSSSIGACF